MKTVCTVCGTVVVGIAGSGLDAAVKIWEWLECQCWQVFSIDQILLNLPQRGESRCPSPRLEAGPVQPVHHRVDTRSVVVAI